MTTKSEHSTLPAIRGGGRHIGVGVDGTDPGWAALAWACEEAEAVGPAGTRLTICSPRPRSPIVDTATMELFDPPLARQVHAVRDRLGGHRVAVEVPPRDPVGALLDLAD